MRRLISTASRSTKKVVLTLVPRFLVTAIIAIVMPAAIKPYSMAVALFVFQEPDNGTDERTYTGGKFAAQLSAL